MLKKYLITSREFYTDTPAIFRNILHEQFAQHLPDYALYRDKNGDYANALVPYKNYFLEEHKSDKEKYRQRWIKYWSESGILQ